MEEEPGIPGQTETSVWLAGYLLGSVLLNKEI